MRHGGPSPDDAAAARSPGATAADAGARAEAPGSLVIGLDLGGTFVDCAVVGPERSLVAKSPTTPADPVEGIVAALEIAARAARWTLVDLLGRTTAIVHGTTLGLNAILTREGGRVGLLTTAGHEDAILIGRVHQKVAGLRPQDLTRPSELRKPDPLVPRWCIRGIDERLDATGAEVVALDEPGLLEAAAGLLEEGCEVLAIGFLWSFLDPSHERRARAVLRAAHPGLAIVLSSDVAPVIGEYERIAATVVDAYLQGPVGRYLDRLRGALASHGFGGRLWLADMVGGLLPIEAAAARPVETLRSGPIGGIMAAARFGGASDRPVVAADMGGTSFDVGLVVDGQPELTDTTVVARYHLALPSVDVRSIGAGGGSIAWLDAQGGLHVGPRSAGAQPGPACYGRGGTEPTVTDADLVLGRLDPDARLGGAIALDRAAAEAAIATLGQGLRVDAIAAAAGIVRVADAQMADLIRATTVERGRDPRQATLVAFGGAGPLHVGRFAAEAGLREVMIPADAPVLSAVGLAYAGYRRVHRRSSRSVAPFDGAALADRFAELCAEAEAEFAATGLAGPLRLDRWLELRYRRQTHRLSVPLGGSDIAAAITTITADFERAYERTFGPGTGYAAAGIEATGLGLLATATGPAGPAGPSAVLSAAEPGPPVSQRPPTAPRGRRRVWFDGWIDTPVHTGSSLPAGAVVEGPAVIDWPATTLVVHPGQSAVAGSDGQVRLELGPRVGR